jgi:AcrR family transcriptional regulator
MKTARSVTSVRVPLTQVPSRGRPGGRTQRQQEQKQETRERLLRAAEQVFSKRSYAATAVEEIITQAGASRTSFYRHFDSKWAIASALCGEVMPGVWELWKELAALQDPREAAIAAWLRRRLGVYNQHRTMFSIMREAVAIEPAGAAAVTRTHDEVIQVLATGIRAFRNTLGRSPGAHKSHIEACLLLMQLDEFTYTLAVRGWNVDDAIAIDVMARQIRDFIAPAA